MNCERAAGCNARAVGKPAADAFCGAKGFPRSFYSVPDAESGYASTRVIGTGEVCDQPFCRGFQMIICE